VCVPDLFKLFAVSAVVMGMSHTIARERIFARLRERLGGKQTALGYAVSCPYCCSHWLAFVLVPLTGAYYLPVAPDWGVVSWVLSWFLSSILITVVAAFFRVAFYFVDETQGLVKRRQKVTEREAEALETAAREESEDQSPPLAPN
jgi:hypothetical protein